jgi:DNA-binding NarL/FixJ family response regulator
MAWKKQLSKRELEISQMVSLGFSNKKIGEEMNISFHTVKAHLRNIYSKTSIKGRMELVIKMLKK